MRTLAEALVAHLAGDAAKARWLYDRSAANGAVVARFNAAFLHEMKEREARIASRGAERRRASGGGEREKTSTRSRRHPTAAARRSANTLGMLLDRIASDPATGDEDLAWAAVTRGDRFSRAGAFRRALANASPRAAARAGVDMRAGGGDGSSEAAGSLWRALYSEASMRRFGIGCAADARRARDALWEAASDCGWRAALAATPPLLATLLLDALQAAADFDRAAADARRRGVFDGGPGAWLGRLPALVAGFVARALVGLGLLSFVWKLVVGPAARRVRAETLFRDRRPVPDRDRDGTRREGATSPGREAEGARGREEAEAGERASGAAEDGAAGGGGGGRGRRRRRGRGRLRGNRLTRARVRASDAEGTRGGGEPGREHGGRKRRQRVIGISERILFTRRVSYNARRDVDHGMNDARRAPDRFPAGRE